MVNSSFSALFSYGVLWNLLTLMTDDLPKCNQCEHSMSEIEGSNVPTFMHSKCLLQNNLLNNPYTQTCQGLEVLPRYIVHSLQTAVFH